MNIYTPELMVIREIIPETPDTTTFRLQFKNPDTARGFAFRAGQFAEERMRGIDLVAAGRRPLARLGIEGIEHCGVGGFGQGNAVHAGDDA